jgi:hypothetical protein
MRQGGPVVVLVPRQLRMTGMTGDVPYYGGRFTPAQAYAASHPRPAPRPAPPPPPAPSPSTAAPAPKREPHDTAGTLDALAHLRDTGVLSSAEYDELRARVQR